MALAGCVGHETARESQEHGRRSASPYTPGNRVAQPTKSRIKVKIFGYTN